MSFGLYLVGYIVLIIGLAVAANILHVPPRWIGVGVVIMIGLGILPESRTRDRRTRPIRFRAGTQPPRAAVLL